MLTRRQELDIPFVTLDRGVDMVAMANRLKPADFREYVELCRDERKRVDPKTFKPGRFNA